jgi:hypothetical protein
MAPGFLSPKGTYQDRRITSLAFNITGVDVTPDMGPFRVRSGMMVVPGNLECFPDPTLYARYEELGVRKLSANG